jgi:hypothetical protein
MVMALTIGCSSGQPDPVQNQDLSATSDSLFFPSGANQSTGKSIGYFTATFDLEKNEAIITQDRDSQAHINVTSYIPTPTIVVNSYDVSTGIVDIDFTILNPYKINAYDPKAIIYTDSIGHMLMNADDWTGLFDIAGGLPINPFCAFVKEIPNRMFEAKASATVNMQILLPGGNRSVKFAIEVSYPTNCEEPYSIDNFQQTTLNNQPASSCSVEVDVYDWQNDTASVYLYCPQITGGPLVPFTQTAPDHWTGNLVNNASIAEGIYTGYIAAFSSGIALYDRVQIVVQSLTPIWPYFGGDAKGRCLSAFNGTTSDNIKWTYDDEPVCSAPSIGPDGTIYCGFYKSNGPITSPGLVAIDPVDGSEKWRHYPAVGNYYGREPAVSPDGQHVYYGGDAGAGGDYRGRLYCINTSNGSQDWFYQLSSSIAGDHELVGGGPKIGPDGTIYFQSLRPMGICRIWAVNPDGSYKWHFNLNYYSYSDMLHHSPCIGDDGYIYVTDPGGQLWKFDSDGNSLWSDVYVNYTTKWPGSLDDENNFYVVCDEGQDVNKFASNGSNLWTTPQWDFYLHSSPAHDADGYIYATGGWEAGPPPPPPSGGYRLRKMDPVDGSTEWEHPLGAITTAMMAISADGYIYIGCGNGENYGPGLQCWDTEGNLVFNLPLPYQAGSPAIGADGTVYVDANHVLYAVGD